jgi:hypothetical protein
METNTQIFKPHHSDTETGLIVKNSFLAKSGFNYLTGSRKFGDLRIAESVSKGAGNILLNAVMVFDQNDVLIFDADIPLRTSYSREKVRQMILDGMMNMLQDSCETNGKFFDELQAYQMLDKKLKLVYFSESYKAVLNWASDIGIEIYE